MTGLDLGRDALIEVAALVTDPDLNVLGDGVDVVIHADDAALAGMPEIVRTMHAKSGLTEEVRRSTVTLAEAEDLVLDYVTSHVKDPRTAPLCGNSIATDRGFLARDMTRLDAHLHYRMIDVSSIKELCRRWYPRVYFGQPQKGWPTARWRTSERASGSWSTTGGPCSCRCPARTWRPRRRSPPSSDVRVGTRWTGRGRVWLLLVRAPPG